jgi:hypothetical protein
MFDRSDESCVMCGGDGRIGNAFGATKTCPGCGGSGRKMEDYGPRDVTKTKSAQGRQPGGAAVDKAKAPVDRSVPHSAEGVKLAAEVQACTTLSGETKNRLVKEIAAYEASHGDCTRTFSKKIRKQIRGTAP